MSKGENVLSYKGTVHKVFDTVQISERFKKREMVLKIPSYKEGESKPILFEAIQDQVTLFDGLKPGQAVEVYFNLDGREWISPTQKVKYFNSLKAWKIDKLTTSAQPSEPVVEELTDSDDLPF